MSTTYLPNTERWELLWAQHPEVRDAIQNTVHLFLERAAALLVQARNDDSYEGLISIAQESVVDRVRSVDILMNSRPDLSTPAGQSKAIVSVVSTVPILATSDGRLRVRVQYQGYTEGDIQRRVLWREAWSLTVPQSEMSISMECAMCGAPTSDSTVRCSHCGTLLQISGGYQITDLKSV